MAITNLGIYPNQQGTVSGTSKRILSSDSAPTMKLRFKTQSKLDTQANVESTGNGWYEGNVWVTVDVIKKGGSEDINGYSNKGEAGDIGKTSTNSYFSLVSGSDAAGYIYEVPFSSITGLSTLLGTLTYSSRKYDAIRLTLEVRCYYDGGSTKTRQVVYIGFIPSYTLSSVYMDKDGLTVNYTASGWNRPNDRFSIKNLKDGTNTVIGSTEVTGTTSQFGKFTIPKDKLLYLPKQGDTLTGTAKMIGSWHATGTYLNTFSLGTQSVIDNYSLKTPTLSITTDADGNIVASVAQGTGAGTNVEYVTVSMVGGEYVSDTYDIPIGGSHTFTAAPYGVTTQWQAVGWRTDSDAASKVVTSAVQSARTGDGIALAGENVYWLLYNVRYTTSTRPAYATAKLAGRNRPTVGFGDGGTVSWQVEGMLAMPEISSLGVETADEQAFRELPTEGIYVMCLPDGQRAQVFVSNMSITRDNNKLRTVSFTAEEVSWIGE